MLQSISISNFILIDNLEINLSAGFTALTGETGAGKSIIIDALLIALGERANSKLIKDASSPSVIAISVSTDGLSELILKLEEYGIEAGSGLIIRRNIYSDGKTKAFINDTPVSINLLSEIRSYLIEFCGQHDSRGLLNSNTHINLFDKYIGIEAKIGQLSMLYHAYKKAKENLEALIARNQKVDLELDFLNHTIQELSALSPKEDEETLLVERRKMLQDSAKAQDTYVRAYDKIGSGEVILEVTRIQKDLEKFPEVFGEVVEALNRTIIELEEAKISLKDLSSLFGNSSSELEQAEDRLYALRGAARKFSVSPNELPAFLKKQKQEFEDLKNISGQIDKGTSILEAAREDYVKLATSISKTRLMSSDKLASVIVGILGELKMPQADFKVEIETHKEESAWRASGFDSVKFVVRTNPGSAYGTLEKIASGGELSRIMLALKAGLASVKSVPVLIFDEIDTGISGAVSEAVGRKIAALAKRYQVLTITHQPQVAAFCDNHLYIEKSFSENSTGISIRALSPSERVKELARMLSGEVVTEESVAAATKLIAAAA